MSNSFERFRKINSSRTDAQKKLNNSFLFNGYPSIKITNNSGDSIQAAVVNKQESDEAYIYTQTSDSLTIGSVWQAKSLNLLIDEEIITIKDVGWHKYHCILCNIQVSDDIYGYFKGPEKSHIGLSIKSQLFLTSNQKPVLVLNGMPLSFRDKIMIKNRAWIVDEYDNISTSGITYYSLLPTTISKEVIDENEGKDTFIEQYTEAKLIIQEPEKDEDNKILVNSGSTITLSTEDGIFKCSIKELQILSHTQSQVIFTIPFGIQTFTIQTKENGQLISETYKVVD